MSKKKKKNNNQNKEKNVEIKSEKKDDSISIKIDDDKDTLNENIKSSNLKELESDAKKVKKNTVYKKEIRPKKHILVHFFLFILLLSSLGYFIVNLFFNKSLENSVYVLITSLLLMLFTILFVIVSITTNRKNKSTVFLGSLCLFLYFVFDICNCLGIINISSSNKVIDFTGMSLTEVVEWATANNIELNQEYEYSDMIKEYKVISQDVKAGTKVKDIKDITVAVSEGANPSKEIIVPNMVSWDTERVLNFIKENYLSNVEVEFVESEKAQDTVIEQSKSGNLKRNEEIKLTFSYGEELGYSEVKLIDFTGMSQFEVEFYLKQHHIRYEFDKDFSKKIKRGYAVKQSIEPGEMVKVDDEKIKVTISKGPKIEAPDLKNMSMTEITNWVIKNKLKLEFSDKYDDTIKDNGVISVSHNKGDILEQGDVVKVVLSKGSLKMQKFDSLDDFRTWADKYEIKYEEKYQFSDSVDAGDVISYSYKAGDVIKNDDSIIVTISDGKKLEVPNLKGMSKSDIISKLKKLGLNYNFVYKNSSSVAKDKAIKQSISAGSEVSKDTTITITLSNGKKETSQNNNSSSSSSNNSSTNNSSDDNNSSNNDNNDDSNDSSSNCTSKTYTVSRELSNIFRNYTGYSSVSSQLYSYFSSNYPDVNIKVVGVDGGDATSGSYVGGIGPGSSVTSCNDVTYTIEIAK